MAHKVQEDDDGMFLMYDKTKVELVYRNAEGGFSCVDFLPMIKPN